MFRAFEIYENLQELVRTYKKVILEYLWKFGLTKRKLLLEGKIKPVAYAI